MGLANIILLLYLYQREVTRLQIFIEVILSLLISFQHRVYFH